LSSQCIRCPTAILVEERIETDQQSPVEAGRECPTAILVEERIETFTFRRAFVMAVSPTAILVEERIETTIASPMRIRLAVSDSYPR
jgi:hypothetical protein